MKPDHISPSQINTLQKCGEQYRRRYILGERTPPGIAMIRGRATHGAIESNMRSKMESGHLLDIGEVTDIAAEKFDLEEESCEWEIGGQYEGMERGTAKGQAKDEAVVLAGLHAKDLAPKIEPTAIEVRVELDPSEALPVKLVTVLDLVHAGKQVRDTKTGAKKPSAGTADTSLQLTAYALAFAARYGKMPESLALDHLIRTKAGNISTVTQETTRGTEDLEPWVRRARAALAMIEAEVFLPAPSDGPSEWVCTPKWCGYHSTCPYVRGAKRHTS